MREDGLVSKGKTYPLKWVSQKQYLKEAGMTEEELIKLVGQDNETKEKYNDVRRKYEEQRERDRNKRHKNNKGEGKSKRTDNYTEDDDDPDSSDTDGGGGLVNKTIYRKNGQNVKVPRVKNLPNSLIGDGVDGAPVYEPKNIRGNSDSFISILLVLGLLILLVVGLFILAITLIYFSTGISTLTI